MKLKPLCEGANGQFGVSCGYLNSPFSGWWMAWVAPRPLVVWLDVYGDAFVTVFRPHCWSRGWCWLDDV